MQDVAAYEVMQHVHELLVREFGRLAPELEDDGQVQAVFLPGGDYAVIVVPSSDETVTVRKAVGTPNFAMPGLADTLLREHSSWLFGRLERNGDFVAVEHTLHHSELQARSLARVVKAVHEMAVSTERLLSAAGALTPAEEE